MTRSALYRIATLALAYALLAAWLRWVCWPLWRWFIRAAS